VFWDGQLLNEAITNDVLRERKNNSKADSNQNENTHISAYNHFSYKLTYIYIFHVLWQLFWKFFFRLLRIAVHFGFIHSRVILKIRLAVRIIRDFVMHFICTSLHMPPSLILHSSSSLAVVVLIQSNFLTPKNRYDRWNFVAFMHTNCDSTLYSVYFRLQDAMLRSLTSDNIHTSPQIWGSSSKFHRYLVSNNY